MVMHRLTHALRRLYDYISANGGIVGLLKWKDRRRFMCAGLILFGVSYIVFLEHGPAAATIFWLIFVWGLAFHVIKNGVPWDP
jgi:hypothetical protein